MSKLFEFNLKLKYWNDNNAFQYDNNYLGRLKVELSFIKLGRMDL